LHELLHGQTFKELVSNSTDAIANPHDPNMLGWAILVKSENQDWTKS